MLVDEDKANDGYLYTGADSTDALSQIHNGGGNLLFADGHVKDYPFAGFPLEGNAALKVDTTPGKIRFEDKAFGPSGYFDSKTSVFASCGDPR